MGENMGAGVVRAHREKDLVKRSGVWLPLCLMGAACGGGGVERGEPFVVTDSAGVTITHSFSPQWGDGCGWTVDSVPVLAIGVVEGSAPYMFDRIMDVMRFPDGGVVVGNSGDNTLRFYDSTGVFTHQTGGTGDGPGEFRQILRIEEFGQHLLVSGSQRNTVFSMTGEFITNLQFSTSESALPMPIGVFADTSALLGQRARPPPPAPDIFDRIVTFYRATTSTIDSIASLPVLRHVPVGETMTNQEFGPRAVLRVTDSLFYFGWTETYDIAVYDRHGALLRRIRRTPSRVPVTDEDIEIYRERFMGGGLSEDGGPLPPGLLEHRNVILEDMVFPEYHPAHDRIVVDALGFLWVERRDRPDYRKYQNSFTPVPTEPIAWDVFDTTDVWLGKTVLPARFMPMDFSGDHIAGIWKNELGVEFVHVYGIDKGCL